MNPVSWAIRQPSQTWHYSAFSTNVDSDKIVAKSQTWTDSFVKKSKRIVGHTVLENKCDNNAVKSSQSVCYHIL